jgi:hypothetical protein
MAPRHACSPTAIITGLLTARARWLVCSLIVGLFGVHVNLWTAFVATMLLMQALSNRHPRPALPVRRKAMRDAFRLRLLKVPEGPCLPAWRLLRDAFSPQCNSATIAPTAHCTRHHHSDHSPAHLTTGPAISTPDRFGGLIHKYAQAA